MKVAPGRKTELTRCSTMRCNNPERLLIAWWLPQSQIPLCDTCYERWLYALGMVNLR